LLELSGVGDPQRLQGFGYPVWSMHCQMSASTCRTTYSAKWSMALTRRLRSIARCKGLRLGLSAMNWFFRRRGPLSAGSALCGGFGYTRDDIEAPDVQFFFASGATLFNANGKIKALPIPAITCAVDQSRPESRGSVHIRSARADQHPEIRANYLATELDRQTMLRGLRMIEKIFTAEAMKPYVTHRMSPVPGFNMNDDTALLAYLRDDAGTAYHPTSTCAIGKVVDARLRVFGIQGLRVADASIMPHIVSGNTNAAAIMIGEKASDLLAEDLQ